MLVVTFVQTNGGRNDPASKSGVCFYPVKEINEKLAADQKKCADGSYSREKYGLPWVDDVKNCASRVILILIHSLTMSFFPLRQRKSGLT